jgi:dipeptidyl-peptidase-4
MPPPPEVFSLTRSLAFAAAIFGVALTAAAQNQPKPLTVEDIFAHGSLLGHPPSGLTWSPDSKHLTYLDSGELVEIDLATAKAHVLVSRAKLASLSGQAAGEQDRDHRDRYHMASYLWSPDSSHLLFDSNGRLWLWNLKNGTGVQIGSAGLASGDDPKFSPDGHALSFIKNHSLAVIHLKEAGTPTLILAASPNDAALEGEVDWIYEEELETRSNYFWSPDSKRLAFVEMNEANVPTYPIEDWIPTHATVNTQRYPQAGDPSPLVRVGIVGAHGGKTLWIKLPIQNGEDYIPRIGWADAKTVWIETLTRDHQHRSLWFADASSGQPTRALELTDAKFLDDNYEVTVGEGHIVLTNWADGHNHLLLYSYDKDAPAQAKFERQLTQGPFEVGEVSRVDFAAGTVDYASNEANPHEQQLWQVDFHGQRHPLTTTAGWHVGNFAPSGPAFVDRVSTRTTAPVLSLCSAAGQCQVFWQTKALEALALRAPEPFEVKAHDGTTLYATLLLPSGAQPGSVPLIVNPYGGPGSSSVVNRWGDALFFDELLAQHGFAVLHADNRGTGGRGRDFTQAAYRNFGPVQFEDQLTVIDAALSRYPELDPKRLGWWGWSWGGTFTLYSMSHSDRFRAGVSVAPVTDFRNYDSIYTERYMGLPAAEPEAYRQASVLNSAAQLKGHLLLVHGTGDDNVHMENSIQFLQKLIEAGIPYDLQLYPRKTHSIAGPDVRTHLYNRILQHFETYLKPVQP